MWTFRILDERSGVDVLPAQEKFAVLIYFIFRPARLPPRLLGTKISDATAVAFAGSMEEPTAFEDDPFMSRVKCCKVFAASDSAQGPSFRLSSEEEALQGSDAWQSDLGWGREVMSTIHERGAGRVTGASTARWIDYRRRLAWKQSHFRYCLASRSDFYRRL